MKQLAVPPWLAGDLGALAAARSRARLPHALLIHDSPGAGGERLALAVAQLALCAGPGNPGPCGRCLPCARVAQEEHPDLVIVRPTEDSRQIRIEQVRELTGELALTSHQGGAKVGVISPAEAMNRFSANALLKTLEEPPKDTLLILVATQPSRLPATILSRCQRLRVRAPGRAESREWLRATVGQGDWDAVLDTIGEAPLVAARLDAGEIARLAAEVGRTLDEAVTGRVDPVATAERWSRSEIELRLACFENWLTERIRSAFGVPPPAAEMRSAAHLPAAASVLNIRTLFELIDAVRELRSLLDTPINRPLALESLLRRLGPAPRQH